MMNLTPTILTIEKRLSISNVCGIYQITHCNLGIVYIGQSVKVGYRLKQHFYDLAAGNHSSGLLNGPGQWVGKRLLPRTSSKAARRLNLIRVSSIG